MRHDRTKTAKQWIVDSRKRGRALTSRRYDHFWKRLGTGMMHVSRVLLKLTCEHRLRAVLLVHRARSTEPRAQRCARGPGCSLQAVVTARGRIPPWQIRV